jgi:O-antigen chain-terminating methyltransferase
MVRIHIPEIKVDTFRDKIRDGARRRGGWASQTSAESISDPTPGSVASAGASAVEGLSARYDVPQLLLQPEFQPHSSDQYHVNDLLPFHDRDFIQNAYRAILKRHPDQSGYDQFLSKLRDGRLNKIDILARLRFSSEGRARKVQVRGLLLPSILRRTYRVPVLGYLMRWLVGLARLPNMIRHQQQFEAYALMQQQTIADYANERGRELSIAFGQMLDLGQMLAEVRGLIDRLTEQQSASWEELRAHLNQRLTELAGQMEARFQQESAERRDEITQSAQKLRVALEQETERLSEQASRKQQELRAEIVAQSNRITLLLEEERQGLPASFTPQQLRGMIDEGERGFEAFYLSFENLFRGSRAEIKERFKVYLPLIKGKGIGADEMPVLDIGCGRGEWLELLKEEGLRARGVDANRVVIEQCRELGLDVVEADLVSYLHVLPDNSVGAITGFHVVEHLPIDTLMQVCDESVRILKPGGVLIFETPNAENVLVGSYYFHFDPTHRKPLPSPTMRFLFEARGLTDVEVINLHPSETDKVEGDSELVKRFNQFFYGPMDYAVVGWKV